MNMDTAKQTMENITATLKEVDLVLNVKDTNFWIAVVTILFNPFYWNCVSRFEYKTRKLTNTVGNARWAVYIFGSTIFCLGLFRDWRYKLAMETQPVWSLLQNDLSTYLGWTLIVAGMLFVVTSYYRLGFCGTFCGDYFGIYLDSVVTGFPYNVVDNPMYVGSTLNFLGGAFLASSQAGIFLGILAGLVYFVATRFEEPFTAMVYNNRPHTKKNKKNKTN